MFGSCFSNTWTNSQRYAESRVGNRPRVVESATNGRGRGCASDCYLVNTRSGNKRYISFSEAFESLGSLLYDTGKFEEAVLWVQKAYDIRAVHLGPLDSSTMRNCDLLGSCHEKLGRPDLALKL